MRNHLIFILEIVILWASAAADAKYSGGTGEPNDPYIIATAEDLNDIGNNTNDFDKHFLMVADINLAGCTGTQFNTIGYHINSYNSHLFAGVFDGNNHTISNFTWASDGIDDVGLFGFVGRGGRIKNLIMENVDVNAVNGTSIGGLAGINVGSITNCHTTGSVVGDGAVGGLVGHNYFRITNCYSLATVSGNSSTGGLVGSSYDGPIVDCYSTGIVTGGGSTGGLVGRNMHSAIENCCSASNVAGTSSVGGLIGFNDDITTDCYSMGQVTGDSRVGGLVGYNSGRVINCYSTGVVSGTGDNIGGLIGDVNYGITTASFWDIETSDCNTSAGGTGKTTAEMKTKSTFTDAGWSFVGQISGPDDKWSMLIENWYPILWWQLDPLLPLPAFSGGSGTPQDPYVIATIADINSIGHNPRLMDKNYILIEDMNISQEHFYMIGNEAYPFSGVFDGNDHKIWNFIFTYHGIYNRDYIGLFGYVDSDGKIKNLGLENIDINAKNCDYVGGLAGINYGQISNAYSKGRVLGDYYIGGLAGFNYGTINFCSSSIDVSGKESIGGLVGDNRGGAIADCNSTGSAIGYFMTGGLVGDNFGPITNCHSIINILGGEGAGGLIGDNCGAIYDCYSKGIVEGNEYIGGLVGNNYDDDGTIDKCYSITLVSGIGCIGGLVGHSHGGPITDCYSKGSVAGNGSIGGLTGCNDEKIINCYSTSNVAGRTYVGGLAGENRRSLINCWSTGDVSGDSEVGGLTGYNDYKITNCYSTSSVDGNEYVGGLVGNNSRWIDDCYSTGAVCGETRVGGLVGSNSGDISNCYSPGTVSGTGLDIGGLVGRKYSGGDTTASFWDIETSDCNTSAGGIPKTTSEMMTRSTFTDAEWDFVDETVNGTNNYWRMCMDGVEYPLLSWQFVPDFTCPESVDNFDLAFLTDRWLAECNQMNNFCSCTDINHDELVNFLDFALFASHWLEEN